MRIKLGLELIVCCLTGCSAVAQNITKVCQPVVGPMETVVTAAQRKAEGAKAIPPITDQQFGFAWPDTPLHVTKSKSGLLFFASDGAHHDENNKYGSITRTIGTLDDPLGTAPPIDVIVRPNPDPSVNPNYDSYTYLGGAGVYRVPTGKPGEGNLIGVYHAEINTDTSIYSLLGLALSIDNGFHWTDLGEIIRLNQLYETDLAGFDLGAPRMIPSLDGQYFYVYFPDWIANGNLMPTTVTVYSVARASIESVLNAASGAQPYAAAFTKYYQGAWDQPGIGGLSTDLNPNAAYTGSPNAAYDPALGRYVMITDNTQDIAYAESSDGLVWTLPVLLAQNLNSRFDYATPFGMGEDPEILGKQFYVFLTRNTPGGWPTNVVQRFQLTCP